MIREYRHRNPTFPHQTTADQFFDEDQFEAYRALGLHIAELALDGKHKAEKPGENLRSEASAKKKLFEDFKNWFERLGKKNPGRVKQEGRCRAHRDVR